MILKFGMKYQAMELYKVCINHDPGMTFTYFMARSTSVAYCTQKIVKLSLKRKTSRKWAGQNICDSLKMFPGVHLPMTGGYIHVYDHNIQTSLLGM